MTGIEYPPTTEQVRAEYVTNRALRVSTTTPVAQEFDEWLADVIAVAKAEQREADAQIVREMSASYRKDGIEVAGFSIETQAAIRVSTSKEN